MKITKLEQQKNKPDRINLYIDDEFFAGISADLVIGKELYEGKEVDQKFLNEVLEQEEYHKALAKSYDYLSRRLHSEKEIWTKMRGKFSKVAIAKALKRLKELGYIDDEKFARAWYESRAKQKGARVIKQELILKGIDKNLIETILSDYKDDDQELEVARELVSKKHWPEMTKEEQYQKVGGYLARRGFDYDVIKRVLNEKED